MLDFINRVIGAVSGALYQPWCVPLIWLCGGIYLTVRLKFVQARMFGECFKILMEKPKEKTEYHPSELL